MKCPSLTCPGPVIGTEVPFNSVESGEEDQDDDRHREVWLQAVGIVRQPLVQYSGVFNMTLEPMFNVF